MTENAIAVYPTSPNLDDLSQAPEVEPGETVEVTRNYGEADCALCNAGRCLQWVLNREGYEMPVVIHWAGLS